MSNRSTNQTAAPTRTFFTPDTWYDFGFLRRHGYDPEDVLEQVMEDLSEWWERLRFTIYGKVLDLPRLKVVFGDVADDGSMPCYRYGGDSISVTRPWTPLLAGIRDAIHKECGVRCNHLVVNLFADGSQYIGPHHDKPRDFARGAPVMTVTLGQTRPVKLIEQRPGGQVVEWSPEGGSLYHLGWLTNLAWKHAVPKRSVRLYPNPRISLTYRFIKTWKHPVSGRVWEV